MSNDHLVELLKWLARRRSPQDILSPEGDALAEMLGVEPGDPSAITGAIDRIIADMDVDAYQSAAKWLVGSGPLRWEALKTRQHRAAQAFGIKVDAFRRKRAGGRPSRETDVLANLALRVAYTASPDQVEEPAATVAGSDRAAEPVEPHRPTAAPDVGPGDDPATGPDRPESQQPLRRFGNRSLMFMAGAATLMVIAIVIGVAGAGLGPRWLSARRSGQRPGDQCPYAPGRPDIDATADEVVEALIDRYEAVGGETALRCALGPLERLSNSPFIYQEFGETGLTPEVVVLAFDHGGSLALPFAAWGSYHQLGGTSGENAYEIGGAPVELRSSPTAAMVILDSDVELVAEDVEAPYFFVVAPAARAWAGLGGADGPAGLPRSNLHVRNGRWVQEFDGGWLETDNDRGEIEWHPVTSAADHLPHTGELVNRIIRQLDGTAWWVTDELRRKWIPDGMVWECLGGEAVAATSDTPGYAVATLPYAGLATCADG